MVNWQLVGPLGLTCVLTMLVAGSLIYDTTGVSINAPHVAVGSFVSRKYVLNLASCDMPFQFSARWKNALLTGQSLTTGNDATMLDGNGFRRFLDLCHYCFVTSTISELDELGMTSIPPPYSISCARQETTNRPWRGSDLNRALTSVNSGRPKCQQQLVPCWNARRGRHR